MDRQTVRILLIGNPATGRLESLNSALSEDCRDAQIDASHSIAHHRDSQSPHEAQPDLVLVFQDWPEQYAARDVAWLLSHTPLTRILCVYGGWCESDGRTRDIWPHAVRVPQWRLHLRLRHELAAILERRAPLPITASRRERFLFDHEEQQAAPAAAGHAVRVVTPDRVFGEAFRALLGGTLPSAHPPETILIDVDPWGPKSRSDLRGFAKHYPQARILALAGFPNHVPADEIIAAGAQGILPKLLTSNELAATLESA